MTEQAISLENVSFSYDKDMILRDLSIAIPKSRICFVMGNNGSGKTTLLKNIMGFLSPQKGKIFIDGQDVSKTDRHTMSRLISYVPQAIHLNTDFSVIDYLSLGRTPYVGLISKLKGDDFQIIEKFSTRLGIDSIFGATFNNLSGGQKQIVAIARSLIQDTPVIIMDEPMSALDIGKQVELLQLLYELTDNKSILLTTHNPNHALAIHSDACFMKQGSIVAYGASVDVIQNELLSSIYGDHVVLDQGTIRKSVVFNL